MGELLASILYACLFGLWLLITWTLVRNHQRFTWLGTGGAWLVVTIGLTLVALVIQAISQAGSCT